MGNPRLAHSCHTRSGDLIFGFVDNECSLSQFRYTERRCTNTAAGKHHPAVEHDC